MGDFFFIVAFHSAFQVAAMTGLLKHPFNFVNFVNILSVLCGKNSISKKSIIIMSDY